jgi:tetratricopeptide (TPR) repeat protein
MGTWCSDSQREVPRLVKTLQVLKFPGEQLSIIGVNRATDRYKQSPNGEEVGKNIHRVPTIIFYKNGEEVNRVIERPVASMEQDMQAITSGEKYTPNYVVVEELQRLLEKSGPAELLDDPVGIADSLKPLPSKPSELAIYGAVQLSHENIDAAVGIFEVNRQLFPDQPSVYADLAAAYDEQGQHEKAQANAQKALTLDPGNESAARTLAGIASRR